MDAKTKIILVCISVAVAGAFFYGGVRFGRRVGSEEASELALRYAELQRERDSTIDRIAEDNQQLRDGVIRAQAELDAATARVGELEEYIRRAGIRTQAVIAAASGARQSVEEASRIIGAYLKEEQAPENIPDSGDTGGSGDRIPGWMDDK